GGEPPWRPLDDLPPSRQSPKVEIAGTDLSMWTSQVSKTQSQRKADARKVNTPMSSSSSSSSSSIEISIRAKRPQRTYERGAVICLTHASLFLFVSPLFQITHRRKAIHVRVPRLHEGLQQRVGPGKTPESDSLKRGRVLPIGAQSSALQLRYAFACASTEEASKDVVQSFVIVQQSRACDVNISGARVEVVRSRIANLNDEDHSQMCE
ncbi:hypothetical protein BIW11_13248, partial [Tropilaelaps mercedesae]